MKRLEIFAAIISVALAAAGCTKDGPDLFKGNWSFKTSGTVVLTPSGSSAGTETMTASIVTESGQMDIITADKDLGDMVITMNAVLGDAVVMNAVAKGDSLTVDRFSRRVRLQVGMDTVDADVNVSGGARRYDDTIIFDLEYAGMCTYNGNGYVIGGSDIRCVAKLNDYKDTIQNFIASVKGETAITSYVSKAMEKVEVKYNKDFLNRNNITVQK